MLKKQVSHPDEPFTIFPFTFLLHTTEKVHINL